MALTEAPYLDKLISSPFDRSLPESVDLFPIILFIRLKS
jgi:hypothetical protein